MDKENKKDINEEIKENQQKILNEDKKEKAVSSFNFEKANERKKMKDLNINNKKIKKNKEKREKMIVSVIVLGTILLYIAIMIIIFVLLNIDEKMNNLNKDTNTKIEDITNYEALYSQTKDNITLDIKDIKISKDNLITINYIVKNNNVDCQLLFLNTNLIKNHEQYLEKITNYNNMSKPVLKKGQAVEGFYTFGLKNNDNFKGIYAFEFPYYSVIGSESFIIDFRL